MNSKIKRAGTLLLLAILMPIFMILGKLNKNNGKITSGNSLLIFVVSFAFVFLSYELYRRLKNTKALEVAERKLPGVKIVPVILLYVISFLVSLLSCFPGVFSYDCYEEYMMMVSGNITSHHPVLHVVLLGGLCRLSEALTQNANWGILVYVILQAAVFMAVFIRAIMVLQKLGFSKLSQYIVIFFWLLSPVVSLYMTCTSKDGLFTAFMLGFLVEIYYICKRRKDYFTNIINLFWFIWGTTGSMIFRKNGVYIVVLVLFAMLLWEKDLRKLLVKALIPVLLLNILYVGPFYKVLNVTPGSSVEMFSVPLQQLARVYKYNRDRMSSDQIAFLEDLIGVEALNNYRIGCADAVKNGVDITKFSEKKVEFCRIWFDLFWKNPGVYVNAFLMNTVDYWYPLTTYSGYENLYGMDDSISNYYDYRVAPPGEEKVILTGMHDFYNYLSTDKEVTGKVFASLFLNSGWYILAWLMFVIVACYRREKEMKFVHRIMFWSLLTVLAGPIALTRYVLIFYYAFPLLLIWTFEKKHGK